MGKNYIVRNVKIKKINLFFLIAILFLSFIIRLDVLDNPRDFWIDESYQYAISQKSVSFILDSPDVHPPLFNLFTKLLLTLGIENYLALRFIMVILSVIFIYAFYSTVKELFGNGIAINSTILISFSLTFIYYSTEFRSYIFALIFVVLQIKYFNRVLNTEGKYSIFYCMLFSLLMIYTHYMTGLILITQILFLTMNWKKIKYFAKSDLFQLLFFLFCFSVPLLIYMIRTLPKVQSFWFKDIGLVSLVSTFYYIITPPIEIASVYLIFFLLLFLGLIAFRKKIDLKLKQFIYYLFFPVILMWVISQIFPFYHHRYFLFGGLSIFILLGWVFKQMDSITKDFGYIFIGIYLLMLLVSYPSFIDSFNTELYESSVYTSVYMDLQDFEEVVFIHQSTFSYLPYRYYFPNHEHYLITTLTKEQLFTAGGSPIDFNYLKNDTQGIFQDDKTYLAISNEKIYVELIYETGGLYVTKK